MFQRFDRHTVCTAAICALLTASVISQSDAAQRPLRPRWMPSKSLTWSLRGAAPSGVIMLKLRDDLGCQVVDGRIEPGATGAAIEEATAIQQIFDAFPGTRVSPAFPIPRATLADWRARGEQSTGEQLADLTQCFVVQSGAVADESRLMQQLLALDAVENCYRSRGFIGTSDGSSSPPPPPPDFSTFQGYRSAAPLGVDALFAGTAGLLGNGVTITDIEERWNLNHVDLAWLNAQTPAVSPIPFTSWGNPGGQTATDHGTASLGVLAAANDLSGVVGLATGARFMVVPLFNTADPLWSAAAATAFALIRMTAGDVMLLEIENIDGTPFETFDFEFFAVRQATALGVHVIEPAGNFANGVDLDNPTSNAAFAAMFAPAPPPTIDPVTGLNRFSLLVRDSGAVFVSGGLDMAQPPLNYHPTGGTHARYPNANFGMRSDSYSWAQNVTTTGSAAGISFPGPCSSSSVGGMLPPINERYTRCFNGTSSAGAIVAGCAAVLEQAWVGNFGQPATPTQLRNLLRTGTPSFDRIGNQPDLLAQTTLIMTAGIIHQVFKDAAQGSYDRTEFGRAVAAADFDGDGVTDIAVGAPGFNVTLPGGGVLPDAGRVYVFSGVNGSPLLIRDGTTSGGRFGAALAFLGNADGTPGQELLVGAPGENSATITACGAVSLLQGSTGNVIYRITGNAAGEQFGTAVALAGKLNTDLVVDFAVGAPGAASGVGRARTFSGANGQLIRELVPTIPSGTTMFVQEFGAALVNLADISGDFKPDLAVGAPATAALSNNPGAVFVFSSADGSQLLRIDGPSNPTAPSPRFGASLARTVDITGTGVAGLVVGAPQAANTATASGFPDLFAGSISIFSFSGGAPALIEQITGTTEMMYLGSSLACGDFDRDGLNDVVVGCPGRDTTLSQHTSPSGRLRIFRGPFFPPAQGAPPHLFIDFSPVDEPNQFGCSVAAAGDIDGDGSIEFATGDVGHGANLTAIGRAYLVGRRPGLAVAAAKPTLVLSPSTLEVRDVPPTDGNMGGSGSPESVVINLDLGAAQANKSFTISVTPALLPGASSAFAQSLITQWQNAGSAIGTLDATGKATVTFGPFGVSPSGAHCTLRGSRFIFRATVGPAGRIATNADTLTFMNESNICP